MNQLSIHEEQPYGIMYNGINFKTLASIYIYCIAKKLDNRELGREILVTRRVDHLRNLYNSWNELLKMELKEEIRVNYISSVWKLVYLLLFTQYPEIKEIDESARNITDDEWYYAKIWAKDHVPL